MKKLVLLLGLLASQAFFAQSNQNTEITPENSWFKLGVNVGMPLSDTADFTTFVLGADLRAQHLVNPNFAIGIASGYNHFFAKENIDDFSLIPLAAFGRYYFDEAGWFIGMDLGYGFLTNVENNSGGLYLNPHIGYNTYHWNVYAFYQHTSTENDFKIQTVGIGATYNIRFK
jgi:hypothetical protein